MTRRSVRAGQSIKLRTRFKDDLGSPAQASDVYVHLFEPEEEDFDLSNAYLVSGVATYLGEGIFEYEFTPPNIDGIWFDLWEGVLTGQDLDAALEFEVSASGTITQLPETQLWKNNVVSVTIASGVQALDGTSLASEHEFDFMTTTYPAYTNIRKVLLSIGTLLQGVEDDTIQTAILEGSVEANTLTWSTNYTNLDIFRHARREYVTCLTASILLTNLTSTLKSKSLGDLRVEYDVSGLQRSLDRIEDCLEKWEPQLISGGGAKASRNPSMVVKGSMDPDRPIVSRSWQSTDDGFVSRRIPAANTRERPQGSRRHRRTYKKRSW